MDDQNLTAHRVDPSRPALGFPLGTALLLLVIFCLSGVFSCCYHWDKIRALRRALSGTTHSDPLPLPFPSSKSTPTHLKTKEKQSDSLPVIMPGDEIARYVARPCPCPFEPKQISIEVQSPPSPPPLPPS